MICATALHQRFPSASPPTASRDQVLAVRCAGQSFHSTLFASNQRWKIPEQYHRSYGYNVETNAFQTRTTAIIVSNIMILSIAQLIQEQLARRLRKPNQANPNLNNYRISHQWTK